MHEKRMAKFKMMLDQIPEDRQFSLVGDPGADITLVCWGSTYGVLEDSLPLLKEKGISANFLHVRMLYPFPIAAEKVLRKAKKLILVENNWGTQLGHLIRMSTGLFIPGQIVKYTGRPMSLGEIVGAVTKLVKREVAPETDPLTGQSIEKVVLTYGL
jgi:2-oxoglutarate ferredoxin oxidoreductase subunit alpha